MVAANLGVESPLGNYLPPIGMTDELEGMDPEALSFRAILPAKYQFLVTSVSGQQTPSIQTRQRRHRLESYDIPL